MNEAESQAGLAPTDRYRYADVVGNELFVAGQVPLDDGGAVVAPGDPAGQVRRCLDNLQTLVEIHGFTIHDVHRVTVHVVGEHADLITAWDAVADWFDGDVPPATLLGAHDLGHAGQLVEIDARVVRRSPECT